MGVVSATRRKPSRDATFTVCIIPDTQRLAANNPTAYNNLIQWIVDNKVTEGIEMVMHLGDYANNGASSTEWSRIDTAMNRLHGEVPFIHNAGNHDYDDDGQGTYSRKETSWDGVFPESDWTAYDWYYDSYDNITTNMAATMEIGGFKYLFLAIEFWPRAAVLTWAQGVIDAVNPDRIIITTHALTAPDANYETDEKDGTVGGQGGVPQFYGVCNFSTDADCKTGQEIFDEFISQNDKIILVMCGHDVAASDVPAGQGTSGQSAWSKRVDTVNGKPINVHLFNTQNISANSYANSAYLRLYTFTHSTGLCSVRSYNPVQDTELTDSENEFTFAFA